MAIARNDADGSNNLGVCYFDITTFKCFLGSFTDSPDFTILRSIISKIRPVEIIYDQFQVTKDIERLLKSLPMSPVINIVPPEKVKSI